MNSKKGEHRQYNVFGIKIWRLIEIQVWQTLSIVLGQKLTDKGSSVPKNYFILTKYQRA